MTGIVSNLLNSYSWNHWLLWAVGITVGLQCLYYFVFYSRLAFKVKQSEIKVFHPLSIIVAARNEEDNLINNLPSIFEQDYPDFEVIVVNDCSQDDTSSVLRAFSGRFKNFRSTEVKSNKKFEGGKKFAITIGVKAAKNEHLVFIDADCKPSSKNWLRKINEAFQEDSVELVLGYGSAVEKNGFWNKIFSTEIFVVGTQYLAFAKSGIPYMGVGRNLAYTKNLFFKNKGFKNHMHLKSGDDDLFVNEVANRKNTRIIEDPLAFTFTEAPKSSAEWFLQKKRHTSTFSHYRYLHQSLLGLYNLSIIAFYSLLLIYLIFYVDFYLVGIILGTKFLIQTSVFYTIGKKWKQSTSGIISVAAEWLFLFLYLILYFKKIDWRKNHWKN